jgi:hypothetical protein
MKRLNTAVALASAYAAPIFVSTAAIASQNDALFGIESDSLISQYCVPRDDNPLVPRLYCYDGRG